MGAGIGRVSEHMLLRLFDKVDIVEAEERFVEQAKKNLGEKLENAFCCRLQDWRGNGSTAYDLIWIQWVLMYADDEELVRFLQRCIERTELIGIKENILSAPDGTAHVDEEDHSIARSDAHFRRIFAKAGLKLIKSTMQQGFPKELYPVRMYLLSK